MPVTFTVGGKTIEEYLRNQPDSDALELHQEETKMPVVYRKPVKKYKPPRVKNGKTKHLTKTEMLEEGYPMQKVLGSYTEKILWCLLEDPEPTLDKINKRLVAEGTQIKYSSLSAMVSQIWERLGTNGKVLRREKVVDGKGKKQVWKYDWVSKPENLEQLIRFYRLSGAQIYAKKAERKQQAGGQVLGDEKSEMIRNLKTLKARRSQLLTGEEKRVLLDKEIEHLHNSTEKRISSPISIITPGEIKIKVDVTIHFKFN
jgi:hypothetical protein